MRFVSTIFWIWSGDVFAKRERCDIPAQFTRTSILLFAFAGVGIGEEDEDDDEEEKEGDDEEEESALPMPSWLQKEGEETEPAM